MPLEAGRLNKRLSLYKPDPNAPRASDGQASDQGVLVSTVWAAIEPLSSRESFQQQQVQGTTTHRITVRFRDDIKGNWWGEYKGRRFNLTPPTNPQERGEMLEILADEQV